MSDLCRRAVFFIKHYMVYADTIDHVRRRG